MTYRSKVDPMLAIGVWGGIALAWLGALVGLEQGFRLGWVLLAVAVGVVSLTFPVTYRLTNDELVVRSGVLRWRIRLDSILSVHPTRNPLSSPAWSLDRLHVSYRKAKGGVRFLLISPADKRSFLRELADRVPELTVDEDQVVRKGGGLF